LSALGCNKSTSKYATSNKTGEIEIHKAFLDATILRPSLVFGPDDSFFNMFAELARYTPALPLIGGGKTKFQPVYVGDVADAVKAALTLSKDGKDSPLGRVYELGGPEVVNFRDIYNLIFEHTGRRRALITLPFSFAKIQAFFLGMLPKPLLTRDQVESLKTDNVVCAEALTLEDLGIRPTGMALILPTYLGRYRAGGRFADKKRA
jgi:NADH dehydrogenase